jgi:hypothetical protein
MTECAANALPSSAAPPLIMPPGSYPITAPVATQERLSKPHQLVMLFNSSEVQSHGVQDRYLQLQMLAPGEKREVAMLVDELATLIHLSRTDRGFYTSGVNRGKPFPPHPLKVLGLPPVQSRPVEDREMDRSRTGRWNYRERRQLWRRAKPN